METFTMSRKELPRPGLMKTLLTGRITNQQAAAALHVSVRQVQRLKRRFEAAGAGALRHGSRDRPSPRRLTDPVREQIQALMQTVYEGFNDSHLTEKLRELHRLAVSRESVRRLRRALGRPPTRRRRAPAHRQRRPREDAVGALVQIDGSSFDWLEGRGPAMTLLGAIDDASSQVVALHFRPTEDLHGYATIFQQMFLAHGLPLALYGDGIGILVRNDSHWSPEEELAGAQHPTHLGRVLRELGIGYVQARSPQGKGRVERLWGTLQDRLVSELRLRGITTREAANAFLPEFIADFNRRFARPPGLATPVWRPAPRDLDRIVSCRYTRTVARDNTVRLGARCVPIPRGPHGRSFARCRVELRELLDGRLVVLYEGAVLTTSPPAPADFALHPRGAPSAARPPARPARAPRSHALTNALTELAAAVAPPAPRLHPWRRAYSPHLAARARRGEHRG
jgi:transposase